MIEMNNEQSISKRAWKLAGKRYQTLSGPLSLFAVIIVLCFIAAYFAPLILLLLVPFVIIPSFFALSASNSLFAEQQGAQGLSFFSMIRNYFSPFARGGYRVIIGFLFSLLMYLGCSFVMSLVLNNTLLLTDPAYIEFRNSLASIENIDTLYEVIDSFIATNKTFNDIVVMTAVGSTLAGSWYFMHHMSVNQLKYYNNMLTKTPLPIADLNLIHKQTIKKVRRPLFKDYYRSLWFFLILIPLCYFGGVMFGKFVLTDATADQCIIIGLFTIFMICLLLIPYYFNCLELIFLKYRDNYLETFISLSLKSIEEIRKTQTIDPEREKQVLEFIEKQKQYLQSKPEENKEENDKKDK